MRHGLDEVHQAMLAPCVAEALTIHTHVMFGEPVSCKALLACTLKSSAVVVAGA